MEKSSLLSCLLWECGIRARAPAHAKRGKPSSPCAYCQLGVGGAGSTCPVREALHFTDSVNWTQGCAQEQLGPRHVSVSVWLEEPQEQCSAFISTPHWTSYISTWNWIPKWTLLTEMMNTRALQKPRARERVHLVKYLSCKREDLSWMPRVRRRRRRRIRRRRKKLKWCWW